MNKLPDLYCIWCGKIMDSHLSHICSNGADFNTRTQWTLEGMKPPFVNINTMAATARSGNKNYDYLDLTPEDIDFLIGCRIRP
jgi:hypothetical protein